MHRKQDNAHRTNEELYKKPGFLAKARARTQQELDLLVSTDTRHYDAAALGQAPYIAVGNGVIVVQRKCDTWGC
jgi:hypothetical protein